MSAKFPRGGGGAGPFLARSLKSLPVCLDQILHFDVYKITLDHILSLEPSSAEFLKTRAGIKNWLNRFETFDTLRFWTKRNAREMLRIIDNTPITYIDWVTYVANSESVISHIEAVLKEIQQASEEEDRIMKISFQT